MEAPVAPLVGRRVLLRTIRPIDYDRLYELEMGNERSVLYRHRGSSVAPEAYGSTLWTGVVSQFVVAPVDHPQDVLGLVACYSGDFRNGHARLAMVIDPARRELGWPLEASNLFIDYLFVTFPFRKLYGDVLEFGHVAQTFGRRVTREEARLRAHEYHAGQYWDRVTYALYREEWFRSQAEQDQRFGAFCGGIGVDAPEGEQPPPPTFDAFAAAFGRYFDLDPSGLLPSTQLAEELGFDSLLRYELLLLLEDLAGFDVPEGVMAEIHSMDDVFHYVTLYGGQGHVVE
jgi:RimJ/RimL family protein N-acetyltransferase